MGFFESVFAGVREPLLLIDESRVVRLANEAFGREFGLAHGDAAGVPLARLQNGRWSQPELLGRLDRLRTSPGAAEEFEITLPAGTQDTRIVSIRATRLQNGHLHGPHVLLGCRDAGDVQHGDEIRKRLEQQLLQAQKMETVGRLAGGIAHDFNNLLTAILGYAEMVHAALPDGDPLRADVEEILRAAASAASLTRQLLAFSRKHALQKVVFDINDVVRTMERMLRRLIGETIVLETDLAVEPLRIRADPTQIEQVIVNLIVNSRDAMPAGGRLVIRTTLVSIDEHRVGGLALATGPYVRLTVEDWGTGMDEDTLSHIFEPFFTSKEQGKGTGLGLPMVHGIVRQSGGHVAVKSLPAHGTTFDVYLPIAFEDTDGDTATLRGTETILVIEDEQAARKLISQLLRRAGYRVLEAAGAREACAVAEAHQGPIHLLVTDLTMPDMSGREAASLLTSRRPEMHVIYCSGYTHDTAAAGEEPLDAPLLQKPYTISMLLAKVREILG